jgi:hypothetical protein
MSPSCYHIHKHGTFLQWERPKPNSSAIHRQIISKNGYGCSWKIIFIASPNALSIDFG